MNNNHNTQLQNALFKAAKVGNIKLVRELIDAGADPFKLDANNLSAFQYAAQADSIKTSSLVLDLLVQLQADSKQSAKVDVLVNSDIPHKSTITDNLKKRRQQCEL